MLRPSSVAVWRHLPPGGKALKEAIILLSNEMKQSVTKRAMPAPRGEGFKISNHFAFKRNETVRYETGDARPRGGEALT